MRPAAGDYAPCAFVGVGRALMGTVPSMLFVVLFASFAQVSDRAAMGTRQRGQAANSLHPLTLRIHREQQRQTR